MVLTAFLELLVSKENLVIEEKTDRLEIKDLRVPKEIEAPQVKTEFREKLDAQENLENKELQVVRAVQDLKVFKVYLENKEKLAMLGQKVLLDLLEELALRADLEIKVFKDFPVKWVDPALKDIKEVLELLVRRVLPATRVMMVQKDQLVPRVKVVFQENVDRLVFLEKMDSVDLLEV